MPTPERKPFTAELQRMKLHEPHQGSAHHPQGPSLLDMCRSIEDLRCEISTLRQDLRERVPEPTASPQMRHAPRHGNVIQPFPEPLQT